MISVEEARDLIIKNSFHLPSCEVSISDLMSRVLSEDVFSPMAYPPFDQSAMDGFAIRFDDLKEPVLLDLVGESAAGMPFKKALGAGQTVRVFTGAKIPEGADTVIMQEKVAVENGQLVIQDKALEKGANVRSLGSQIKKGSVVLRKGQVVNPAVTGLLASLGITKVRVAATPRVTVIVTGNELVDPGCALQEGQVYESNSYCLKAALESVHCRSVNIVSVKDDAKKTIEVLKSAFEKSDIVLAAGGISVGKYDFVGSALLQLGVQNVFYKIAQKPGKPLFFGKLKNCLIFGLPGNPAAALTCFYEYVLSAIKIMIGDPDHFLTRKMMPIADTTFKKEGLSLFLKGKITGGRVEVLEGQESSNICSFTTADCLIYLPAQKGNISAGELVEIHLLP